MDDVHKSMQVARPIIFVLGIAHSGSTLLGRMLDMHPEIQCFGELMRIDAAIKSDMPCSCGSRLQDCEFWSRYIPMIEKANNFQFKRFTPDFYEMLRQASGSKVIADLSKTRVIRMMNNILLGRKWKSSNAGFILLIRDPRGVGASSFRRGSKPIEKFLWGYEKWLKRYQKFARKNNDSLLLLRYEDLCMEPEKEMKRVCRFMGIDFDARMLFPADKTHHFVYSSTSGYMKNVNNLKVDERWRSELMNEQIKQIEVVMEKVEILRKAYLQNESPDHSNSISS